MKHVLGQHDFLETIIHYDDELIAEIEEVITLNNKKEEDKTDEDYLIMSKLSKKIRKMYNRKNAVSYGHISIKGVPKAAFSFMGVEVNDDDEELIVFHPEKDCKIDNDKFFEILEKNVIKFIENLKNSKTSTKYKDIFYHNKTNSIILLVDLEAKYLDDRHKNTLHKDCDTLIVRKNQHSVLKNIKITAIVMDNGVDIYQIEDGICTIDRTKSKLER